MEADSTTYVNISKESINESLPFVISPGNSYLYEDLTGKNGDKRLEIQIVERLQAFGLLPTSVTCPTNQPQCNLVTKTARVIDRVQWQCEGCGKRLPIRTGSFFQKLQCSLLQALQMLLAWCEDADCEVAAQCFGVKPRMATMIYEKLDELVTQEQNKDLLGGPNTVVIAELYPDCLTRLSPDTTDQPHVHRILMLADTKHIPTNYHLHVIKPDYRRPLNSNCTEETIKAELEQLISKVVKTNSTLVSGFNVPTMAGVPSLHQLLEHGDADMQHFLSARIWRRALALIAASRDLCGSGACAGAVQRYLSVSLYRHKHSDNFYQHMLQLLAEHCTSKE